MGNSSAPGRAPRWSWIGVVLLVMAQALFAGHRGHSLSIGNGSDHAADATSSVHHTGVLVQQVALPEGMVQPWSGPHPASVKDRANGFSALVAAHGRSVLEALVHGAAGSVRARITLWRSSLLYPFHIFW